MWHWIRIGWLILLAGRLGWPVQAQVYSPKVLAEGQVDASSLPALARGIYARAGAQTDREKAEAIWRFFLTDGRFVRPGFWYHIAGWTYEEPNGEVLDALKLLNSYGFGLCYHVAPLLEAVFEAGGFADARVWFLTDHSVAEVYYGGAYHYYDSDMMGYNCLGDRGPVDCTVASVHQIEENGRILTGKLLSPTRVNPARVDYPWYPADLRAGAIGALASLFTTRADNRLYPFKRYSEGHAMEFVLRPGERLIRYFQPENKHLFYLPYRFDGAGWHEFPREVPRYHIRTRNGPRSQKDGRLWGTGRIEYTPHLADRAAYYPIFGPGFNENLRLPANGGGTLTRKAAGRPARAVFAMPSPYVIIDAEVSLRASLAQRGDSLVVETSTDMGRTWRMAGRLDGPFSAPWRVRPKVLARSAHGELNAVAGTYGYLVRITWQGPGPAPAAGISKLRLRTRFELNPRTLPALHPGRNRLTCRFGPRRRRWELPVRADQLQRWAVRISGVRYVREGGQGFLVPEGAAPGEIVFELSAPSGAPLVGFDAGGRFLDLRDHAAPDKLTAEVRRTAVRLLNGHGPSASLAWSTRPDGDYQLLWVYRDQPIWLDLKPVKRLLRWPEVDRRVRSLPPGTRKVYLRYRMAGMALDHLRLAALAQVPPGRGKLEIIHLWEEDGHPRRHVETVADTDLPHRYSIPTAAEGNVANRAIILACP